MDRHGIRYSVVDLEKNPEMLAQFSEQGFTSAPIVTTDTKIWSGFRKEKIDNLALFIESLRAKGAEADPNQAVIDLLNEKAATYRAEGNYLDASGLDLAIAVIRQEV
jgi:glutaredoxin